MTWEARLLVLTGRRLPEAWPDCEIAEHVKAGRAAHTDRFLSRLGSCPG